MFYHAAGRPFPGLWQEYSGASCCLTFMRNVACRFHLRHFALLFCTWCLLQEGSDFHGISTEPCCESGWTGELIRNIRKTGRKTKKKENCWRLLYCNISPQGSKQEMLVPVAVSKANLSSLKRQIFTEVCKHASLPSLMPAFFPFLSHS